MSYAIFVKRSAEKEIDELPKDVFQRLSRTIHKLKDGPFPHGAKKLSDRNEYRLRIGDWRMLYIVNHSTKTIEIVTDRHTPC